MNIRTISRDALLADFRAMNEEADALQYTAGMSPRPYYDHPHPEALPGEVFVSNISPALFEELPIKVKRLGHTAFDGRGTMLAAPAWFPLFVRRSDFSDVQLADLIQMIREREDLS